MEFGIYTFVENTPDPSTGKRLPVHTRLKHLMEEITLADECGLDVYAIGEHHRSEYISSAPAVLLAAAASQTSQIRLSSSVTVLGSEDPVRVFQQFATLDQLAPGRAEIMVGRGSFIESFPLFGYDLQSYESLFSEKLDLLLQLREEEIVTWQGTHRPAIQGRGVYPRPHQDKLPIWRAVGGTPQSAYDTGARGLPMALGIIGGYPARFTPLADLHKRGAKEAGHSRPRLSLNMHGFIADTSQKALELAYPAHSQVMNNIGKERGWPPITKEQFTEGTTLEGANMVGAPEQIVEKILYQHELFGHDRFLIQLSVGTMPQRDMLRAIELLGTHIKPAVMQHIGHPA
ncbi:MAG: Atu2307/SP_0267 family LLM class monooxygenase [Balneolaceae bacterium]